MLKQVVILQILFTVNICAINAQQDPLLTHFIYNKMGFNPGSTGLDDGFCATTAYRNQWGKVDGAPNSAILNLEANVSRFFPGGLGINFYHDIIGFSKQNNLMLNYSYPIEIGEDKLGVGLGIGMLNFGMNNPVWITPDQTIAATNDKSLLKDDFSRTGLDINFGIYYKSAKNFYLGLSTTHLNSTELSKSVTANSLTYNQSYKIYRHLYLMSGYKTKQIGIGVIDLQMMLRSDLKKISTDLNARYIIGNIGYAGLTYRTSDALSIMLGFMPINNFTVGYSYDLTVNKLSSVSRGSHEILMKYCYFLPVPPLTITRNPRWL